MQTCLWATVHTFPTGDVTVGIAIDVLDESERAAAARFVGDVDRIRYVSAHFALRRILANEIGLAPEVLEFRRAACPGCGGPHGRPELIQEGPSFSLTHAGDYTMVAISDRPVGVDLERLSTDPRLLDDLIPSLHPTEREEIEALGWIERNSAVMRCWVRKEAVLKAIGTGIGAGVEQEYVGTGPQPAHIDIADLEAPPGYVAALAVR